MECSNWRIFLILVLPSLIVYCIVSSSYFINGNGNGNNIDDDYTITGMPQINTNNKNNNNNNNGIIITEAAASADLFDPTITKLSAIQERNKNKNKNRTKTTTTTKKKKKKKKATTTIITNAKKEEEEEEEEEALSSSSSLSLPLSLSLSWTDEDPNRTHWWESYINTTSRIWDNNNNNNNNNSNSNEYDWCNPINKSDDDPNILFPIATNSSIVWKVNEITGKKKQIQLNKNRKKNQNNQNQNNNIQNNNNDNVIVNGILYIKSYKTASSTAEGINIQIAHNVADRKYNNKNKNSNSSSSNNNNNTSHTEPQTEKVVCSHWNRHEFAETKLHSYRQREGYSLLWTLVRQPRKRDLSQVFFFLVSRGNMSSNNTNKLINGIQKNRNKQMKYLIGTSSSERSSKQQQQERQQPPSHNNNNSHSQQQNTNNTNNTNTRFSSSRDRGGGGYEVVSKQIKSLIIDQYDFIGVTERLPESLAVMTLLWNLHPTDVIVLSTKKSLPKNEDANNNGVVYDDGGGKHICKKILSPPIHPTVRKYLNSKSYINKQTDYLLYYAVNESLDRTIQVLGPTIVQERMILISKLQRLAEIHCQHDERTIFPCSSDGIYQGELSSKSCYVQDAGCGHECVNHIMDLYNRGEIQLP